MGRELCGEGGVGREPFGEEILRESCVCQPPTHTIGPNVPRGLRAREEARGKQGHTKPKSGKIF